MLKQTQHDKEEKMNFWEKIKKDLQKGIKEGVTFVKEGAAVVKEKAEELTEESKRQYKIFELKRKVHEWITELGGKVYELSSNGRNPMLDVDVKLMIARIKKIESQITRLEGKRKVATKKTPAKRLVKAKSK